MRARAWIRSHPITSDAVAAAVLLVAAVVSSDLVFANFRAHDPEYATPDTTAVAVGLAALIAPLSLRRRAPIAVLATCTAALLFTRIVLGSQEVAITTIAMSLAVYSAAAHGRPRLRTWVCGICLIAVIALSWRDAVAGTRGMPTMVPVAFFTTVLINTALFCAMWALGVALGSRRRRTQELLERTVELEREREENASRAVFDERVRIARELHDVVAHHVSMMGVQAGAARVVIGRDPAKAKDALSSIEASSRQAVAELHGLLGFLRRDGDADELAPQPGLAELDALAQSMSDSELVVEVRVEGERRALAPTVDVSAYRIVQEALTNTLKHAGASRADVLLRYRPGELELEITDDGRANGKPSSGPGGLGLIGMRERAGLHGGRLTAGPGAWGGYVVRVTLPTPAGRR
jgi:signal transduction histidine kinase